MEHTQIINLITQQNISLIAYIHNWSRFSIWREEHNTRDDKFLPRHCNVNAFINLPTIIYKCIIPFFTLTCHFCKSAVAISHYVIVRAEAASRSTSQ
jgi:hypothetical protein